MVSWDFNSGVFRRNRPRVSDPPSTWVITLFGLNSGRGLVSISPSIDTAPQSV
jgi:hypothetical protein